MTDTDVRLGGPDDLTRVVDVFALAFADDPVWGVWSFPEVENRAARLRDYWAPFVEAAIRFDGIEVLGDYAAVALWVPPGVPELDAEGEAAVEAMVPVVCPERGEDQMSACFEAFESNHPTEPHWYLSLLATHPDHRGKGAGMALVEDRLAKVDAAHAAAFLESTNPANLKRYQRAGFELSGSFVVPDGPTVDQMWRGPR